MSEVKTSFVADDKEMLASYRRMQKELDKYKKQLAETGQAHKKAGDQAKISMDTAYSSVTGYVGGLVSIGAAVAATTRLYAEWDKEIKRVTESHKTAQQQIVKTLGAGMDLRNASQIEAGLKGVGLSPEQANKAFGSATGAAPGMSSARRIAIINASAPLAGLGQDVSENVNVATKIANLDSSMTAGQAANMAASMRARAGEDANKIGSDEFMSGVAKLKAAGMSTAQALAISQAGVEADLPSKAAKSIAESLWESDPTAGKRGRLTADDRSKRAFYAQGAGARWKALQDKSTAESILGGGGSLNVAVLGDAAAQLQAGNASGDFIAQQQAAAGKWATGRQFAADTETAARTGRMDVEQGKAWGQEATVRNRYTAMLRENNVGMMQRGIVDLDLRARATANQVRGKSPLDSTAEAIDNPIGNQLTQAQNTELKALIQSLRDNTAATKAAIPNKAKKNIDAHNE